MSTVIVSVEIVENVKYVSHIECICMMLITDATSRRLLDTNQATKIRCWPRALLAQWRSRGKVGLPRMKKRRPVSE